MDVECRSINFSYDDKPLLRNVSIKVSCGEHIWIRGNSGSGKSSFLKLIGGILVPQSGTIFLGDTNISSLEAHELKKFRRANIGYLNQENRQIGHWSVEQNLQLIGKQLEELLPLIKKLNLEPEILKKKYSKLSGGEKQRISLARIILQNPPLALIDEPTSHLDDVNASIVIQLLSEKLKNSTIVLISHDFRIEKFNFLKTKFEDICQ